MILALTQYIYTAYNINVKVSPLQLQYLSSLIKLRGGSVTVLLTIGRGDGGLKPPIAVSRLGQFRSLNIVFAF